MLKMKKVLAIMLAAATAFTFAPVSTLGLTGVVEAQAATPVSGRANVTFPANDTANEEGVVSVIQGKLVGSGSTFTVALEATGTKAITVITGRVTTDQQGSAADASYFNLGRESVKKLSSKQATQLMIVTARSAAPSGSYYFELTNGNKMTYVPFSYTTEADQDKEDAKADETRQDARATAEVDGATSVTAGTTDKTLVGTTGILTLTINNTSTTTEAKDIAVSVVSAKGATGKDPGTPENGSFH